MKKTDGFTVIELVIVIAFLIAAAVVLVLQINNSGEEFANTTKRTAINAMYYSLEEGFYPKYNYYPEHITEDTLPTMDKELLSDPNGVMINEQGSAYRYEPKNCHDGQCKEYTLRATLFKEDDFVKQSRHK